MSAPKVYDWNQKQWVMLPDHEVTDAVAAGTHSFEEGIEIPIVDPSGALGTIPSEHIQNAFKQGYRWQTGEDLRAYEQQQAAEQAQARADAHPIAAFAEGVVKGAIPGATWMQEKMAPLMGGTAEDVRSAANELKAGNPGLDFAGEMTGAIVSPITEALGGAAGKLGAKAAGEALDAGANLAVEKLGSEAAMKFASSKAANVLDKVATKGVGEAFTGAYYGLHAGLNESALGEPNDVAETLMHSMGEGLIFGGVAGAALGAFPKTKIKELFSAAAGKADEATQAMARYAAKKGILPTIPEHLREAGEGIIDDPELRSLLFTQGGDAAVSNLAKDTVAAQAAAKKEMSRTLDDLNRAVRNSPKQVQDHIDTALTNAGGEIYEASNQLFNDFFGHRLTLESKLAADQNYGSIFGKVDESATSLIDSLKNSVDANSQRLGYELDSFMTAQKNVATKHLPALEDGEVYNAAEHILAGREVMVTNELRDRIAAGLPSMKSAKAIDEATKFREEMTDLLHNHEIFGGEMQVLDHKYEAMDTMRGFLSKQNENLAPNLLSRLKNDPEAMHEFDAVMNNFADLAPTLQSLKSKLKDPMEAQAALNAIKFKIRDTGARGARLSVDDYVEIGQALGNADIATKAERLRELEAVMLHGEKDPISKYVQSLRALGRPVPENLMALEHKEQKVMDYMAIKGAQADQSTLEQVIKRGGQGILKQMLLRAGGTLLGATIGHSFLHGPIGAVAGAVAGGMTKRLLNPATTFESLTKLERHINKSYQVMEEATHAAIDGLTGKTATKAAIKAGTYTTGLQEKKKTFAERAQYLEKLGDPDRLAHETEERVGSLQAAPNISTAMGAQYVRGVQFLTQKLPVDPLAHQSIHYNATDWKPSDFELAKFERYADTVENPTGALYNIAKGRCSPEEIETLQTCYPQTFKRLQDGVLDAIMKPDIKLSYAQKVQLGSLFGVTADVSMRPDFILKMQGTFSKEKAPEPQKMAQTPAAKMPSDSTEVERLTYS